MLDSVIAKAKSAIQKREDLVHGFPAYEVNYRTGSSRWGAKRAQVEQARALTEKDVCNTRRICSRHIRNLRALLRWYGPPANGGREMFVIATVNRCDGNADKTEASGCTEFGQCDTTGTGAEPIRY